MGNACCLNCEERHIGCHSKCEKYKKFRQRIDNIKEAKIEEKKQNRSSVTLARNLKRKMKRQGR